MSFREDTASFFSQSQSGSVTGNDGRTPYQSSREPQAWTPSTSASLAPRGGTRMKALVDWLRRGFAPTGPWVTEVCAYG